ncbi:MAG: cation:proton antiporter [Deltaproteobacteria bacterium]|nr:cation:proton antiporter [Deltaproteobacteria bacterium]
MSDSTAILLSLALPLICALLLPLFRKHPNLREGISITTAVSLFVIVMTLVPKIASGARPSVQLLQFLPGITIAFELEPLGMLFAMVASGLWIVTTLYAIGYMRGHNEKHQTRFFMCFAVAIASALGIAFSKNLFTLFVFYEVLTMSTYPLVTHHGTAESMRAGRTYLGILLFTSMAFLLFAIIWTWSLTGGNLNFTAGGILAQKATPTQLMILLGLFAFGTGKAALMPFHKWLPAAMVAPTPVSALLHAVAVVKAGVFTIMKIVVYIFGIELLSKGGLSIWLMYVAAATILVTSIIALTKDNLKARLAYSTISQLSYIVLGAALANKWGVIGGSMHIAMHAFGKITLFFCAGAIYVATHKKNISDMDGIGRKMPITMGAFFIGSLCVIGLPPSGGSWSKWFLIMGAQDAHQVILSIVLMLSSLLSVAYLMPVVARAFFAPSTAEETDVEIKEAPFLCVLPLCVTAAGCIALFVFGQDLYLMLKVIVP